uniref:J domain-containing protein n=1 Tax=Aplanochytrium stocchinoi TaxID=215587 RepID=A0A7S3V0Z4_9STRA
MSNSAEAGAHANAPREDLDATYCQEVLNAVDYFEVLGFPKYNEESINIAEAELRRHYLRRSMRVHPDKNKHPKSTEAFQRIAVAYETLSIEQKKNEYILLLRQHHKGYSHMRHTGFDSANNIHFSVDLNSINLVDAFALFASIVEQSSVSIESFCSLQIMQCTNFEKQTV